MPTIILPEKWLRQPSYQVLPDLRHPLFHKALIAKAAFPGIWVDLLLGNTPASKGTDAYIESRSGIWVASSDASSASSINLGALSVPTAEITLMGLFSKNNTSTTDGLLTSKATTGNGGGLLSASGGIAAYWEATDGNNGTVTLTTSNYVVHPFCTTCDAATLNFYLDGQVGQDTSKTYSATTLSGSQNLYLGKRGTSYTANSLGLVLAHNRIVSKEEYDDWRAAPWQILKPKKSILYFTVSSGGRTGTLAATESGSDTASISGDVLVKGALAATESGSDSAAIAGKVLVEGALSASESGTDIAALAGDVLVKGTLAASESGNDTASFIGEGFVPTATGTLAASESGSDTASIAGKVYIAGTLSAVEGGLDGFAASGNILVQGTLAASETGDDTAAFVQETLTLTPADLNAIAAAVWADPAAVAAHAKLDEIIARITC